MALRLVRIPGFRICVGFGRRPMSVTPAEVEDFVLYQIGALEALARAEGVRLQHVKAHGALYNMAIRDRALADAIARAVAAFDRTLLLLSGCRVQSSFAPVRLPVCLLPRKVLPTASYESDGSLTPRSQPGAVIHDPGEVVARAVRMAREGVVLDRDGEEIPMRVATICTHGDTPGSHELTRRLREGLEAAGMKVRAVGGE